MKIAIADDHQLILEGLQGMLKENPEIEIVFTANSGKELMHCLESRLPRVLLLDIELPDNNGIELCKIIKKKYPDLKIIALTNHDETVYVKKMMKSGANGYLLKGTDRATLIDALRSVSNNELFIDETINRNILKETITGKPTASRLKLTKRETEILALIAHEYSNQEIADKLFLSIRTVESHRLSLTQKLDVKNSVGLVKEAFLRGLINH